MIFQCPRVFRAALVVLLGIGTLAFAESDPSALFLNGYTDFQNGERLERDGDFAKALAKYRSAAQTLQKVAGDNPDWQPLVVEYRLKKILEAVQRLEGQVPAGSAPGASISFEGELPNPDLPPPRSVAPESRYSNAPETGSTRQSGLRQELQNAQRAVASLEDRLRQTNGELKRALVEIDRFKVSLVEKDSQLAQTQIQLENARKDLAARPAAPGEVSPEVTALRKELDATLADREVLEEENAGLMVKLEQASTYIKESDAIRGTLEKERKELAAERQTLSGKSGEAEGELKKALAELAESREKIAQVQKLTGENSKLQKELEKTRSQLEQEKKRTDSKEAARLLMESEKKTAEAAKVLAQNKELLKQLAAAEVQIQDFGSLQQANAGLLNTNEDLSRSLAAKDAELESAKRELAAAPTKELEQKLAEAEKRAAESQTAQTEKEAEVKRMQTELSSAGDRLFSLRADLVAKDTRITDLEKQLDTTTGELAKLKLSGTAGNDQALAENEVLRGAILRQIREQARKDQAKRLIDEEISRLQITSDSLSQQLKILAEPFQLTEAEKKMFRMPVDLASGEDASPEVALALEINKNTGSQPMPPPTAPRKVGKVESLTDGNQALARQAKAAFDDGRVAEAEKIYQQVVDSEPNNPYALSQLGAVQFEAGKVSAAEVALKKTLELVPNDAFALTILGIVHYRQEKYDEAQRELEKAIAVDPQRAMSYNYLGIVYSQQNDLKKAENMLQKAIEVKPDYADAHFNLAIIYATQKPPSKELARRHYQKATQLGAPPDVSLERMIQ